MIEWATDIKIHAERRAGEMLKEMAATVSATPGPGAIDAPITVAMELP